MRSVGGVVRAGGQADGRTGGRVDGRTGGRGGPEGTAVTRATANVLSVLDGHRPSRQPLRWLSRSQPVVTRAHCTHTPICCLATRTHRPKPSLRFSILRAFLIEEQKIVKKITAEKSGGN